MINDDFRAFAISALQLSTRMLEALTEEAQRAMTVAEKGGARLQLEFGPLPAFDWARLVLVEPEGRRHVLASVDVAASARPVAQLS